MRKFGDKTCKHCGSTYTPVGSCSKYCSIVCQRADNAAKVKQQVLKHRIWKTTQNVGIGSGTGSGSANNSYKNRNGMFRRMANALKQEFEHCEVCGKDLFGASRWHWCVHHLDHDHYNNVWHNLQLLCKSCHQRAHDCGKHLKGVETTRDPITGRYKRIEAPDTVKGDDIVRSA